MLWFLHYWWWQWINKFYKSLITKINWNIITTVTKKDLNFTIWKNSIKLNQENTNLLVSEKYNISLNLKCNG